MSSLGRDTKTIADYIEDLDHDDFLDVINRIISDMPMAAYYSLLRYMNSELSNFEDYYLDTKLDAEVAAAYDEEDSK